jgi:hypothetical protein
MGFRGWGTVVGILAIATIMGITGAKGDLFLLPDFIQGFGGVIGFFFGG